MCGRRRWTVRLEGIRGGEDATFLVVEVPRGTGAVHVRLGDAGFVIHPRAIARLRWVLLQAVACALWDRGDW